MLREVFRTETIKLRPQEKLYLNGVYSMVCTTKAEQDKGDTSIRMHGLVDNAAIYNGIRIIGWRYHSITGKLIAEFDLTKSPPPRPYTTEFVTVSRAGKYWACRGANADGLMWRLNYGNIVTVLPGEPAPTNPQKFWTLPGEEIHYTHWESFQGNPPGSIAFLPGDVFAVDDTIPGGLFLCSAGGSANSAHHQTYQYLAVFNLTTGKWKYDLYMPGQIVNMVLEDASHVYVLLQNRDLVLVDYVRGEILGAAKIPPLETGLPWGGASGLQRVFDGARMSWDPVYRRLLLLEETPETPEGQCTVCVRGYQMVNEPHRLTVPIPLKVPREGRVIPVLVQAVDDLNQGVGGFQVEATVAGGTLVGVPITNYKGDALIQVAVEGSPLFSPVGSPVDTGSDDPTALGFIKVTASVRVPRPPIPISGVPGAGATPAPGTPTGPMVPGDGHDEQSDLPETAPNMMYVVEQVFASQTWNLAEYNERGTNGRGAFTEKVTIACHDKNARFGHIRKDPGQNQYNGHAVDALVYKNPDEKTGEVFDIVSGGSGAIGWMFSERNEDNYDRWKYPL